MNIAIRIENAARSSPDKVAILFEEQEITYQALNACASIYANLFLRSGVIKGDRVALFLPNSPEFIFAYYGALKLGAIVVSVNVMLKKDEVDYTISDSNPVLILTTQNLGKILTNKDIKDQRRILFVENIGLDNFIDTDSHVDARTLTRDTPAAIIYSSGTTGFPKGILLSHENISSNTSTTVTTCGIEEKDILLLSLPLFHCFGQNFIMNSCFLAKATLVLQRRFSPEEVMHLISRQSVTMVFGVPTIFINFLEKNAPLENFSGVRYFFTAGAHMPEEVSRRWYEKYGKNIYEGYGLTESSPFATYNHSKMYVFGSVGAPIENVEIKIVDAESKELEPNKWGEILIKGPNVMLGYWNNFEATQDALSEGWLRTGDIGFLNESGYLYIRDRLKDMIITSGFNVYSVEVENIIYLHPSVREVAVFGVPDPIKIEAVAAAVVCKEGINLTESEVLNFCREKIAAYKVPKFIVFVDDLPKNAIGKVLKNVLRQNFSREFDFVEKSHTG